MCIDIQDYHLFYILIYAYCIYVNRWYAGVRDDRKDLEMPKSAQRSIDSRDSSFFNFLRRFHFFTIII